MLLAAALALAGCAVDRTRELTDGLMRQGQYEEALLQLDNALKARPDDPRLRAGVAQARTDAATRLAGDAARQRAEGRFDEAQASLRRAKALAPGNPRIDAMLAELLIAVRQREALVQAESLVAAGKPTDALRVVAEALRPQPRQPDLLALQRRLELDQRQNQIKAAGMGLSELRPISLDFREANLRTVLDVVSRNSGINFILDKDIRADTRVTVFLRSAKVEDAIDLITSTYQLAKKVVDGKTLLIYPNTPDKQREHQEQVVKVFYMANADAKSAAAFLRSMLKIREPHVDERSNMLAVRDSPENVLLAERLIALFDTGEPEVLLELEVVEVRSSKLTELGLKLPNTLSLTPLPPVGETGLTLGNVGNVGRNRIGLTVGGATVNLLSETGDFNTLASPRIRVRNREKARIMIGDKIPVVSATTGQNGFVTDSVSYLDVGLKLDVEPTVYVDDDVAIRVGLEVSTLGSAVKTTSGTLAYQIGTRNATTMLRLRDGETQLLAGLISTDERTGSSRLPGVGDLPVLGRLFTNTRDDNSRTELVLSITPRVLRNVRRPDANESEMWVGTELSPRLRPVGGVVVAAADAPASTRTQEPSAALRPGAAASAAGEGAGPRPRPGFSLQWDAPAQVKVGETFTATLAIRTDVPLRGAPVVLSYVRDQLEVVDVEEGDFFRQGGVLTSFTKSIVGGEGRVTVGVLRNPASGALGQGTVMTVRMKALKPGVAEMVVSDVTPVGLGGPVDKPAAPAAFAVQAR